MLSKVLTFVLPLFTFLLPKNKYKWVFASWHGEKLADNPEAFQRWILKNRKNIRCIWIVKKRSLVDKDKDIFYFKSPLGLWHQATAKIVFITHSIHTDLYRPIIAHNTFRVQMWHGAALKKIGFDDAIFNKNSPISRMKFYRYLSNEYYSWVLSLGPRCSKDFQTAFDISKAKLLEVGFPRNDKLLKSSQKHNDLIVYFPTFRGKPGQSIDILSDASFNIELVDRKLSDKGLTLIVRLHPVNKLSGRYKNTNNIIFDDQSDTYDLLSEAKALITDYSSVMFDFSITEKPILFLAHDLNEYLNNDRKMYFDYFELGPEHIFSSWIEISKELDNLSAHKSNRFLKNYHSVDKKSASHELYEFLAREIKL